tara:strand:+ start:221 stop:1153 length:933 start_codon:yes stop_codon:yes gene_type:complete
MIPLEERLSLSTCWCSHRHTDGYDMLTEIREMGFHRTELSHGVRMSLVPGIIKAVEEGVIAVSSIHNFCPLPSFVQHAAPNLFQPSAKGRKEKLLWLRYSLKTLDFAVKVGAKRIVMHSGSMRFLFGNPAAILDVMDLDEEQLASGERKKALAKLHRKAAGDIRTVINNYRELAPYAAERGLELGAENREGLLELPLDDNWSDFLGNFDSDGPVQYWHDTGHAQIKHRQGLMDHRTQLETMADRLIGFHLHDVSEAGKDHQVPGSGTVDFAMIAEFVKPSHTLIAELSPRLTRDQVTQSREYLLEALSDC